MTTPRGGNFFEDFRIGQVLEHGPPRTLTHGDAALYTALYGARFAPQAAATAARALGFPHSPLDDMLVFHTVFGKTVPDVSLNAIANLGYAECQFLKPVYAGATLNARSTVIGLKENANRQTGVVYVRSEGFDETGSVVLRYVRWVMVRKRSEAAQVHDNVVPKLETVLSPERLTVHAPHLTPLGAALGGGGRTFESFQVGDKFDHADGVTIEEAEHMLATRLYHNTARVHFNQHAEATGRFGKRIVYGGHVISIARALSFNGLETAWFMAGINSGRHVAPCFAGDTVYAWSEVLDTASSFDRGDAGFLRLRTIATKNRSCADWPAPGADGAAPPELVLDLDYWVVCPRGA